MSAFRTSFFRDLLAQNVHVYGQLLVFCRDPERFRGNVDRLEEPALEALVYLLILKVRGNEQVPGVDWITGRTLLTLIEEQHLRLQKEDSRLGLVLNLLGLLILQEQDWRTVGFFVERFQRDFFELAVFYEVLRMMLLAALEKDSLRTGFDALDVTRMVANLHSESQKIQLKSLACLQLLSNFRLEVCEIWLQAIVLNNGRISQEHRSFMLCHLVETGVRREDLRETMVKVLQSEDVWNLLNDCCESSDQLIRKQALSVIKSLIAFQADKKSVDSWQSFVTIVEALNESQTHLVLPALPFVGKMGQISSKWKNSALKLILKHENNAVSGWGISYILQKDNFNDKRQTLEHLFLSSLNRTNLFQDPNSINLLQNYYGSPEATSFLLENFRTIPWNSVPFANLLQVITQLLKSLQTPQNLEDLLTSLLDQCQSVKNLNLRSLTALNLSQTIVNLTLTAANPQLDKILLNLETLAGLTSVKLIDLNDWEELHRLVDGRCFERLLAKVRARKRGDLDDDYDVLVRDVLVPFMRNERTSTERRFGQMLEMDAGLAVRLLQYGNLSFSEIDLKSKLAHLLHTTLITDNDSGASLQSVEILQQLSTNPQLISLLDEILPKLVVVFHKRLNRLNYDSLPIAVTVQLVRLFCNMGRMDMVDLFLDAFTLDDLVATIQGCNEEKSLHETVFSALSEVFLQRLKAGTVNELVHSRICQDFPKLIDLGSVQVLYSTLETLTILLTQPETLNEETFETYREVISRCYREILIYRKSDHFMKLMAKFVQALVAPITESNGEDNASWLKEVVQEYCGMFLEQAVAIGGLANLLFEQLLMLPVAALLDWAAFARFLLVGLMLGEGQKREQRIEDEFCAAKALTTPLFTPPVPLQSDARVRVMCVLFMYRLAVTCHPDATLFLLKLERMLIERFQQISKAKERYYADSQTHRHKLRIVQALCVLLKLTGTHPYPLLEVVLYETNQPNINYLIELILADSSIDTLTIINSLKTEKVKVSGVQSVFVVLWLRCCKTNYLDVEYINFLLPWTMAQNFSTRLYAQITISKLIEKFYDKPEGCPFANIHAAINSYLKQGNVEKNLEKCMKDFRFNSIFDYGNLLTLENVFNNIPRVSGMAAEDVVPTSIIKDCFQALKLAETNLGQALEFTDLTVEKRETLFLSSGFGGTDHIQKKIVPLKSTEPGRELLGDLPERLRLRKKGEGKTDDRNGLIVVASLVDRPPNLGGLARSSEIFGVKQYVVGSLKDVESKEFQALSMTAEKWLPVAELKSFQLADYLREMKAKGYAIVGAEQTTGSRPIQQIRFPARAVLVLGHEKEGLPAHIISQLDFVAEIPQFGVVRSLNVHVTGAIFMWEYAKQHLVAEGS